MFSPILSSQANMAVYFAILKPQDTVMGMDLSTEDISPTEAGSIFRNVIQFCALWSRPLHGNHRLCGPGEKQRS